MMLKLVYICLQFSSLVDLAVAVTTLAGVTHRIGELLEVLQNFPNKEKDKNKTDKSDNTSTDKQERERTNFGYVPSPQIHGNSNQRQLMSI